MIEAARRSGANIEAHRRSGPTRKPDAPAVAVNGSLMIASGHVIIAE